MHHCIGSWFEHQEEKQLGYEGLISPIGGGYGDWIVITFEPEEIEEGFKYAVVREPTPPPPPQKARRE